MELMASSGSTVWGKHDWNSSLSQGNRKGCKGFDEFLGFLSRTSTIFSDLCCSSKRYPNLGKEDDTNIDTVSCQQLCGMGVGCGKHDNRAINASPSNASESLSTLHFGQGNKSIF